MAFVDLFYFDSDSPTPISSLPCARCNGKGIIIVGKKPFFTTNAKGKQIIAPDADEPIYGVCPRCNGVGEMLIFGKEED